MNRRGDKLKKRATGSTRQCVEFVVSLIITVLLTRAWFLEGFIVPSSSMAETLEGVHCHVVCAECGQEFDCGTDLVPMRDTAICLNCGFSNQAQRNEQVSGDRLLVHKSAYLFRSPRRWEVIVFRRPDVAAKVYIKRVIGLPGEEVQIREGDVFINGQIQQKSLEELRAVSVLVHDSRHVPHHQPSLPPRWASQSKETQWLTGDDRFICTPSAEVSVAQKDVPIDWLTYRHWVRLAGSTPRAREVPLDDSYAYNRLAAEPQLDVHPVKDVMLRAMVEAQGTGNLLLLATDGRERFLAEIHPASGACRLIHAGAVVAHGQLSAPLLGRPYTIELALCDQQVLFAVDGESPWPAFAYPSNQTPWQPSSRPLAIGSQGLTLDVASLEVWRDVYYTHPRGYQVWAIDEPYQLAADEYFVLGDNSPVSEDSRLWEDGPGVPESLLVGKPLAVHLPSRLLQSEWGQIQVPDPARIRYIR
jgi:signal peptidase I